MTSAPRSSIKQLVVPDWQVWALVPHVMQAPVRMDHVINCYHVVACSATVKIEIDALIACFALARPTMTK